MIINFKKLLMSPLFVTARVSVSFLTLIFYVLNLDFDNFEVYKSLLIASVELERAWHLL